MNHGLAPNIVTRINKILTDYTAVEAAVLYGSRAKGNFKPGSDVDLSLKGEIDFSTLLRISHALDDANMPYRVDVNVFNLLQDADLIDHINRRGVVPYQR
jgi:predicted nucleotidyltransferase